MDVPPSQTVYVNNLYEKLPKEELKKCLYAIFSQFGKVLEVVALKTQRLRGQAWVVFSDVAAATNALRTLQGFPFFEKPIRISYAKTKSDAIAKLDGSFKPRKKKADKGAAKEPQKREKTAPARAAAGAATAGAGGADGAAAPNKILFVQNLPRATTDMMLGMLFQQFPGFREVRMVEARPGIAFVEFENEVQAGVALSGLNGFKITPENAMQVTYGKQ